MGLDVWIEVDGQIDEQGLRRAFLVSGAIQDEESRSSLDWHFPASGMFMEFERSHADTQIKAEDTQGANFKVAWRCVLRLVNSEMDLCLRDLEKFLETVASDSKAHFVASFQLENAMYVNTGSGLRKC
jgi:hypothetical protein